MPVLIVVLRLFGGLFGLVFLGVALFGISEDKINIFEGVIIIIGATYFLAYSILGRKMFNENDYHSPNLWVPALLFSVGWFIYAVFIEGKLA